MIYTQTVRCPGCKGEIILTLEKYSDGVILTKQEARTLYNQFKNEWLNRDEYDLLKLAMRKLDV